ncbi:MAG: peptide deformylase [Gemmatimonadota bacterium]|jgi:peptide deformylase
MIREIVLLGDPVLRTPADEVEAFDDELRQLVEDMFETMYHAEGIGLAAPQVGISRRVLVVDVRDEENGDRGRLALVNPEVVDASPETDKAPEGCLSIPGIEDVVERPCRVEIRGYDPSGREVRMDAEDLFGRALQHEIDHLDGVLFLDRVSPLKRKLLLKKWKKLRAEETS